MHKANLLIGDSSEEAWLFADLFASLLMTIVLLINAHSSVTMLQSRDQTGKKPPETRLVYLLDAQTVSLGTKASAKIPINELVVILQNDNAQAEIVGSAKNNGLELFALFQTLEKEGITYSYSIEL